MEDNMHKYRLQGLHHGILVSLDEHVEYNIGTISPHEKCDQTTDTITCILKQSVHYTAPLCIGAQYRLWLWTNFTHLQFTETLQFALIVVYYCMSHWLVQTCYWVIKADLCFLLPIISADSYSCLWFHSTPALLYLKMICCNSLFLFQRNICVNRCLFTVGKKVW